MPSDVEKAVIRRPLPARYKQEHFKRVFVIGFWILSAFKGEYRGLDDGSKESAEDQAEAPVVMLKADPQIAKVHGQALAKADVRSMAGLQANSSDPRGCHARMLGHLGLDIDTVPAEGLYILCLYARAGENVFMGRYEYRILVDHVLWTCLERPRLNRERELPAPNLLLAAYALAKLKQKETLQRLLPALREAVSEATSSLADEEVRLLPNEVSKLAWIVAAAPVSDNTLLLLAGELSWKTPGMTLQHLAQVAMALAISGSSEASSALEAVMCRALPDDSKETYEAAVASSDLRTGDLQALASGFLRGAVDVAKLAPRLLAAAEAIGWHRVSCSCKVILFRGFDRHRELLEPKDVATVEAYFSEVLETMGTQLDKAAEPSASWAQTCPEQFRASMEDLKVTELDVSSTAALLARLDIDCDWPIKEDEEKPEWEAEAESVLWRVREIPVLEAHPVPDRGQTFGHVEWMRRNRCLLEARTADPPKRSRLRSLSEGP
ncbi:unnamed protein product [Symbiodinium sp. CCMP2592]|nr:unnamed protein product [Symbiodinium sp. CCMP2592]